LSAFLLTPRGLFLPVACKKKMCRPAIAATRNGARKWNVKNRVSVALSTANPPQSHVTRLAPQYGMAENKLVMTVAPQKLIWPQGNTYPRNAAAITRIRRVTPVNQVLTNMYLP